MAEARTWRKPARSKGILSSLPSPPDKRPAKFLLTSVKRVCYTCNMRA